MTTNTKGWLAPCLQSPKSQQAGRSGPWPPASAASPAARAASANESVTPQSSKVCVVRASIIYLFTRLQLSACLSNSIIDWEPAASRRPAGLRANSLQRGGLMPGPGEAELTPCGSACRRQEDGGGRGGRGCGQLSGPTFFQEPGLGRVRLQQAKGAAGAGMLCLGTPAPGTAGSP